MSPTSMGQATTKGKGVWGFFVIGGIIALAVALNVYGCWRYQRQAAFDKAPEVRGEVVGRSVSSSTKGTPYYTLRYQYEAPEPTGRQRSYESTAEVQADIYQRYPEGSELPVRYLPEEPSISNVPGNTPQSLYFLGVALVLVDGFFTWIGLVVLRDGIRHYKRSFASKNGGA